MLRRGTPGAGLCSQLVDPSNGCGVRSEMGHGVADWHTQCRSGKYTVKPTKALRQIQHLPRLDFVGIAQLVAIGLEDFHVHVGVTKLRLGDLAQRIACFDRVGLLHGSCGGTAWSARHLDVGDDVVPPRENCLDRQPNLVLFRFGGDRAREIELSVAFLGCSVELPFRGLNGVAYVSLSPMTGLLR